MLTENDYTRMILSRVRKLNEENQNVQDNNEIVVNQNDPGIQDLISNINKLVGALKIDDRSMIVYPNNNDTIFNGAITDMNNLKFQFRYNDQSGGLYIWADSMLLTKDVADKLNKLVSIREQWKEYWSNNISQYTNQK